MMKYKGTKLVVFGTVAEVRKGPLGGVIIGFMTPNPFMPVDASLEDSEKERRKKKRDFGGWLVGAGGRRSGV
jgi:hypothetical protein